MIKTDWIVFCTIAIGIIGRIMDNLDICVQIPNCPAAWWLRCLYFLRPNAPNIAWCDQLVLSSCAQTYHTIYEWKILGCSLQFVSDLPVACIETNKRENEKDNLEVARNYQRRENNPGSRSETNAKEAHLRRNFASIRNQIGSGLTRGRPETRRAGSRLPRWAPVGSKWYSALPYLLCETNCWSFFLLL